MRPLQFTKMQGLGNDFIVIEGPQRLTADEVREICDRHLGVGADGILMVGQGEPIRMDYWNADGSPAEMCGNGLRCVARYAYDKGWAADRNFSVQTPVGVRGARVLEDGVEVEIGRPQVRGERDVAGITYRLVDVGNPHAVAPVDDPDLIDVEVIGRRMQKDFDDGINVEFFVETPQGIRMRVWERGVGETLACGSGMVAAAMAAGGDNRGEVDVEVPGGVGRVLFRDGSAWLAGPAEYVFRGSVGER